jgi:hypothetical protein
MLTYIGGLVCLVFGGIFISLWYGVAPQAIVELPVPMYVWVLGALGGAVLIYFNRRPGN